MSDIKMTINGKSMTEANIKNELENIMITAATEGMKEQVLSVLTQEEVSEISIDLVGSALDSLSLEVSGPEHLVKKIEATFNEE
jgi:serine protease inhibitor ecotin